MDDDENAIYPEERAEEKLEALLANDKSAAQLNREADSRSALLLLDVLQPITADIVEIFFNIGVDMQVRDQVYGIELEEMLKAVALPPPQARIGAAKSHLSRKA